MSNTPFLFEMGVFNLVFNPKSNTRLTPT